VASFFKKYNLAYTALDGAAPKVAVFIDTRLHEDDNAVVFPLTVLINELDELYHSTLTFRFVASPEDNFAQQLAEYFLLKDTFICGTVDPVDE
jgi:hypothetical protein